MPLYSLQRLWVTSIIQVVMNLFKKLAAVFIVLSILVSGYLILNNRVSAQENQPITLPSVKTLPGEALYPFKRLFEKARLAVTFSKKGRINYKQKLLGKRLSELYLVADSNKTNAIETSAQRFAYHAGIYAEEINKASEEQKGQAIRLFDKYKTVLSKIRDKFPANTTYWLSAQQDIDTLDILSDKF